MTQLRGFLMVIVLTVLGLSTITAQNRGTALSFQGVENALLFTPGLFGSGLDGVAGLGKTVSIFNNPAGLTGFQKITMSVGYGQNQHKWWENQNIKPNRLFVTLPFYLEGLYIPDPANNGLLDSDIFFESLLDTTYVVADPEMGVEHFSEEAADWSREENTNGLTHLGLAIPVRLGGKEITFSLGYANLLHAISFDRNATYLTPNPGYIDYAMPAKAEGMDTVHIDWFAFERLQKHKFQQYDISVGFQPMNIIHLGAGFSLVSGSSQEYQHQDKIGYFDLYDQNEFSYSYDTLNTRYLGEADYSGIKARLGAILEFDKIQIGLSYTTPLELSKSWSYTETTSFIDDDSLMADNIRELEGEDTFRIPASYSIGFQVTPVNRFAFSLGYEIHPYVDAELTLDENNPFSQGDVQTWMDQTILYYGCQYQVFNFLGVSALYRSIPQVYIPDGSPIKDSGPETNSYTFGVASDLGVFGNVYINLEYLDLKYQDIYFSNTNYAHEQGWSLRMSYSYSIN
ncbi:MAG: hypothetical protein U9Q77_13440 [Candidatus Marinimicrobia bacterium]|nr:hypothetical protein [Candidatus Neomarinimicrobiota bacterium]